MGLLERIKEGGTSHEEKMDELQHLFPKTKQWLHWWSMADVSGTLFPSLRTIFKGGDKLPDTTNAQESMHHLYYVSLRDNNVAQKASTMFSSYSSLQYKYFHTIIFILCCV
jgi:hypothetical protein